ncbi:hypothetical protein [Niabella drilacis]|nr:hypothetical protein [Niabella drilacis]
MDTKLIKQFGAKIGSYRIRTERQKKRLRYKDFDKQLLELDFRLNILYKKRWNLGWEPLTPPFQRGWKRFFVLKEDVATGKQAVFFEQLLKKINTTDYSWRKDFTIKKRKRGRKVYLAKEQHLQAPGERNFKKHFSPQEQLFFYEQWRTQYGYRSKHFVFSEPWRFTLTVQPHMISKKRIIDPELSSLIKQTEQYLEKNCYNRRLAKLRAGRLGYKHYRCDPKSKELIFSKKKNVPQWLDEIKSEQFED